MSQSKYKVKKTAMGTLVGAAILTLSMGASACGEPDKVLRGLDLTSEQKTHVHELLSSKRDEKKGLQQKRKALKQKRASLVDHYSEVLATEIATEAGELATQATLLRIHHQQKILAILTDEQKQKFKKAMIEKNNQGKKRHQLDD